MTVINVVVNSSKHMMFIYYVKIMSFITCIYVMNNMSMVFVKFG
jgi:hypothetical protein